MIRGHSHPTLTTFGFFWPPTPCVDIFYGMNVDKKWTFLDHLPTSSCKRSLWTTPYCSQVCWVLDIIYLKKIIYFVIRLGQGSIFHALIQLSLLFPFTLIGQLSSISGGLYYIPSTFLYVTSLGSIHPSQYTTS